MRSLIIILVTLFSTQLFAAIYSWKDENGVTHFSEKKPNEEVDEIKTINVEKDPESELVKQAPNEEESAAAPKEEIDYNKLSDAFLLGSWSGYSEVSKKKQEWIFKEDGFFSIKQILNEKSDLMYTGQWELDFEDILLSIAFKAETNDGNKSSGFVSIQNSAEIYEYSKDRIQVNFNEEEFWLERN